MRRGDLLAIGLLTLTGVALACGLVAMQLGHAEPARQVWASGVAAAIAALLMQVAVTLRRGEVGLDLIALLSMSAALWFGEELAGNVVAVMYSGGQFLESFAGRRARREMTAILQRVPRTAQRHGAAGLEQVGIEEIAPGDLLLIRQGDTLPADGVVERGSALLDQSALTGEALPVERAVGGPAMSGSVNLGSAFDLRATRRAAESTYASILRLVEAAERVKAPMSRLADRYAVGFLAVTLSLAGAAWALSGEETRLLAVLVIATPCPLILAVPVALISGLSRAARHGILVKGGGALEALAAARILVLDKTGTLTLGGADFEPRYADPGVGAEEALRLAASLDQASVHPTAEQLVGSARARGLNLSTPGEVREQSGAGIEGMVEGWQVRVGSLAFVMRRAEAPGAVAGLAAEGGSMVAVALDGRVAAVFALADAVRPEARTALAALKLLGIERIVLATGDHQAAANRLARDLPLDSIQADLAPQAKVDIVIEERKRGPVMMVGDGVNDAPALAAANIGIAMGGGAAGAAEAADIVLLVDDLSRLPRAIEIAQRSRRIARQSVAVGIGLSVTGMIAAALGYIPPVQGALAQEAIDVMVIVNALRALGDK